MDELALPEEEVAQQLANLWLNARQRRQDQEPEQPAGDQNQPPAADPPQQDPQPGPAAPPADKRRYIRIAKDLMVTHKRLPDPSDFAIRKLRNHEYVELWYFTPKGCTEAARTNHSTDMEALSITQVNNTLELQPARAAAPAKGVVHDEDLTWAEMTAAKNSMIDHMARCDWDKEIIVLFMEFYFALDTNPIRLEPHGDQALLTYQAEVRKDWHHEASKGRDHIVFNIAVINEKRLLDISEDLFRKRREQALAELKQGTSTTPRMPRYNRTRNFSRRQRSQSPVDPTPTRRKTQAKRKRSLSPPSEDMPDSSPTKRRTTRKSFRNTSSRTLSVCAMCLGRHPHDVANCDATLRWDGKEDNRCTRNQRGYLRAPDGTTLCTDWQKPQGCSDHSHDKRHQCSGCGAQDHGAQDCPRAQAV